LIFFRLVTPLFCLGVTTIFNPSPVSEHFNLDFFKYSDFVILNETEAAAIIGDGILNIPSAKSAGTFFRTTLLIVRFLYFFISYKIKETWM
jgi:sugar/nucleoside kinase (ribokinase family)